MKSYIAIILGVSVVILIYVIYLLLFKSSWDSLLSNPVDFIDASGNVKNTVIDSKLITSITSSNYAISCWVCVNNWKITTNNGKTIYGLLQNSTDKNFDPSNCFTKNIKPDSLNTSNYPIFPWNDISASFPTLYVDVDKCYYTLCLDSKYPNLYFTILAKVPSSDVGGNIPRSYPIFITDNFPMQKWTNVIISMEGNQMDAYIDGKLIQSGPIAYLDNAGNTIALTKKQILSTISFDPTFIVGNSKEYNVDISVTRLSLHSNAIDPQTAASIYRYGSGVSSNRTKVNISLSQNNNIFRDIKLI